MEVLVQVETDGPTWHMSLIYSYYLYYTVRLYVC